jgi:FtsP/CotA-like multicopper oxidase with cupredoxin domain
MTGTLSVLGASVPIWGFSATGAAGSATTPGPLLVVHQGDQVRVTLHNHLSEAMSLAFPGQQATAFAGAYGDDTVGAAANGSRTYSFVANRPGTFAYEAGHTPAGARQVAMGLAGALVVLPADGSAYGSRPGYPATSYDDDVVLVIGEIDPAFNASPATFDLRAFAPKYRLLNGKPYPASDPIATDQGRTVLLRYVNVGSQSHAMSLLGGSQLEIAQDAHPMRFATTVTADTVQPGETLDTLVVMPTGPEAKLALYEPAMHLDNNGQHAADPGQLAFGGLLTFLDTNAPPPSIDGVGPVSSHITLTPNPSDGKSDVTVTADLSDATTGGSAVTQAEFVIDDAVATGVGFGMPMTAAFGTVAVTGATAAVPAAAADCSSQPSGLRPVALSCLPAGKHLVYVRALDAAGNWGVIGSAVLNLPKTGPQTRGGGIESPTNGATDITLSATGDDSAAGGSIVAAEYFVDAPGPDGSGVPMGRNHTATVVAETATLAGAAVAGLGEGTHHLLVHSKDSLGLWGPALDVPLVVDLTGPAVDAADVAPNPSNGVLSNKSNPGYLVISAAITDRDAGSALQSNLSDAEAFLDPQAPNPVGGSGIQLLAVDGAIDSPGETVSGLIPISQVRPLTNGTHHVYVRGQDAAGNWGPLFGVNLVVDKIAPVLGALAGDPNPTNGADVLTLSAPVAEAVGLAAAEFWLGTTDPGVGRGTRISVAAVGANAVATVPLVGIAPGTQRFNLRVQDTAGNWSNAANTTVVVTRPNAIFAALFEGSTPGWSSATGRVSTSTAARLPSVNEPDSTKGLAVTIPSGAGGRVSYVTDTTPSAETGYHARFTFDRNTLTSGARAATVLTLFETRTAGNNQVFALQFRVSGTTPQIRVGLARTLGTTYGPWISLTAGQHVLQVDWVAGSPGSLALSVDGVARSTVNGNTGTLRVETVLMGVTAGVVTGAGSPSGTAYFDSFVSARNNLSL